MSYTLNLETYRVYSKGGMKHFKASGIEHRALWGSEDPSRVLLYHLQLCGLKHVTSSP